MRYKQLANTLKTLDVKNDFTIEYFAFGIFDGSKHFDNLTQLDYTTKKAKCFEYNAEKKVFKIDLAL